MTDSASVMDDAEIQHHMNSAIAWLEKASKHSKMTKAEYWVHILCSDIQSLMAQRNALRDMEDARIFSLETQIASTQGLEEWANMGGTWTIYCEQGCTFCILWLGSQSYGSYKIKDFSSGILRQVIDKAVKQAREKLTPNSPIMAFAIQDLPGERG